MTMAKQEKQQATKTAGSSLVKYGSYSIDEAEDDAKEFADSRGSGIFMKLKPGKHRIRVIPPLLGKKWKRVFYQHFVDVPGLNSVSFVCPLMEEKKPCPVCATEKKLLASDNESDQRRAKKLKASRRVMINVIDRNQEEAGPKVLTVGPMIENQLIELRKDEDLGGDFVDPIKGIDVLIIRSGVGATDTEYKVAPANKGIGLPLSEDSAKMNEWISGQHNLDRYVRVHTAEEIQGLLRGEKPNRDESSRSLPSKKTKSIVDDDDEDDTLDDEDDE
jgi:hypothetical protein